MLIRLTDILLSALPIVIIVKVYKRENAWNFILAYWCIVAVRNNVQAAFPLWAWLLVAGVVAVFLAMMACLRISAEADEDAQKEAQGVSIPCEQLIEYELEADILREAMEEEQW